jgi:hypothetical protein
VVSGRDSGRLGGIVVSGRDSGRLGGEIVAFGHDSGRLGEGIVAFGRDSGGLGEIVASGRVGAFVGCRTRLLACTLGSNGCNAFLFLDLAVLARHVSQVAKTLYCVVG